jgi:uncharacterized protein
VSQKAVSFSPFDASRWLGTLSAVTATDVEIQLQKELVHKGRSFGGQEIVGGVVGEYLFLEADHNLGILARIYEVREITRGEDVVAIGRARMYLTLNLENDEIIRGVPRSPRIGQKAYCASSKLIAWVLRDTDRPLTNLIHLGQATGVDGVKVAMRPEHVFERHCAIVGTTGSGKSYSVARLVEEIIRLNGKAVLIDPTGEFAAIKTRTKHIYLGGSKSNDEDTRKFVGLPFYHFTEQDLLVLFQASGQVQAPKLRDAMRSLKLAKLEPETYPDGLVRKQGADRSFYEQKMLEHAERIFNSTIRFDAALVPRQIELECVFPTGRNKEACWGGPDLSALSNCITMVSTMESLIRSKNLACIFQPSLYENVLLHIKDFVDDPSIRVLRISAEYLSFEQRAREITITSIGRRLLANARDGKIGDSALVTILDEAHNFIKRESADVWASQLDAFGLIAKEGRKYGLHLLLSTQRPRDVPEDVLSQVSFFVVHQLMHERDQDVMLRALGSTDRGVIDFLPVLGQGEAILVGEAVKMALPLMIDKPAQEPSLKSDGFKDWRQI